MCVFSWKDLSYGYRVTTLRPSNRDCWKILDEIPSSKPPFHWGNFPASHIWWTGSPMGTSHLVTSSITWMMKSGPLSDTLCFRGLKTIILCWVFCVKFVCTPKNKRQSLSHPNLQFWAIPPLRQTHRCRWADFSAPWLVLTTSRGLVTSMTTVVAGKKTRCQKE